MKPARFCGEKGSISWIAVCSTPLLQLTSLADMSGAGLSVCKWSECMWGYWRRETERNEFAEAKDRLKHSWAADRDDFARVKDALKKKNADHHVQNGRLSQSLKVRRPLSLPLF